MRKTETEVLEDKEDIKTTARNNILERVGDESITRAEGETQVSAAKTLSYADGRSVYFGEAAERAPHPCTFWSNITHSQMECREGRCCSELQL